MLPDLNRLKIFFHVHSRLSITAAAEELHITPSAVSQQIKKLEAELKTPLFTRLHKRLVPTSGGNRLFKLVAPLIDGLSDGMEMMEKGRKEPAGLLKIGAPVEFGSIYLPHVISTFRAKYDKVTFNLELGRPSHLFPKVSAGELDFALIDTFPTKNLLNGDFDAFSITPVMEEEVVLACSKKYNQRDLKDNHSYQNLIDKAYIAQQHNATALKNWFQHHFGKTASKLNIVLTVSNHSAVVSAVRHHVGLGIVVSHLVDKEIHSEDLVVVRKHATQTVNRISIVQLLDKIPTITEKSFLTHFHHIIQKSKTLRQLNLNIDL
ncbi:MAG: LysR family transcriptional regulator [Desulfobacteraceae bacterium]|jgi:DNA-binding transcriptional LysR family regulator